LNTDENFLEGVTHFKSILPEFFKKDIPIISDCEDAIALEHLPSEYPEDRHLCYAIQLASAFTAFEKFRETDQFLMDCEVRPTDLEVVKFAGNVLRQKLKTQYVAVEGRLQTSFRPCFFLMPDGEISATVNIVCCPTPTTTGGVLLQFQYIVATKPTENGKPGVDCLERSICLENIVSCGINSKALCRDDRVWFPKNGNRSNPKSMEFKDYHEILKQNKIQLDREEQRELAIKRREEEIALRAARAALVTAVAKIDVDLERIKNLKELNKEVALKNQKIADRKEAEKLALAAEQRHAEKLKQKEIERQKFLSKKN
jgi:hypothetical protein